MRISEYERREAKFCRYIAVAGLRRLGLGALTMQLSKLQSDFDC
jgi:hypothetical protein